MKTKRCPECGGILFLKNGKYRHLYSLEEIFKGEVFCDYVEEGQPPLQGGEKIYNGNTKGKKAR